MSEKLSDSPIIVNLHNGTLWPIYSPSTNEELNLQNLEQDNITTNLPLHGHVVATQSKTLPSLKDTQLLELVTTAKYNCPFSFNMLKMAHSGEVAHQQHDDQHAIYLIQGSCQVMMGEDWVTLESDSYAYIPPQMPHAFKADEQSGADILILKI